MDVRKIKKLIELIESSDIDELEIVEGDDSVRITRNSTPVMMSAPAMAPMAASVPAIAATTPSAVETAAPADTTPQGETIDSPMVGTFYASSSPTSPPFVSIGQTVSIGDTLCIIEAMKMLNQIEADKTGVIKEVLVDNETPVEFGQPLFVIE